MDTHTELDVSVIKTTERGRKRTRDPAKWIKNIKKVERYTSKCPPKQPECGHKSNAYKCCTLTKRDVNHFNALFYKTPNKLVQDYIIIKYCSASLPKRKRAVKEGSSRKGISITYYVKKATLRPGEPGKIPVCQKTFLGILGFKKTRVQNICKKHFMKCEVLNERRGGDTRSKAYEPKRKSIAQFIEQLKPLESHYCRGKSNRHYLPSDLSINKLWRMYNTQCTEVSLKVTKSFFRNYVNRNFNIGFGQPAMDVCSQCLQLTEQIKRCHDSEKKSELIIKKRVHSMRAKAFFQLLKERNEETLVLSYECQKNHVLPKVPDQSAYYSRQIFIFNFTVCRGSSRDTLDKGNVIVYCWTEKDHPKGANEIASAVYHNLCSYPVDPSVNKVRLFADGCGGQNQNGIIVGMLSKWLLSKVPKNVNTIELIFPVTGHSFMPADRVFARIEKVIKRKDTIIEPCEYMQIFSDHGTLHCLGSAECPVYDWKTAVSDVQLPPGKWHFKFKPSKRIILSKSKKSSLVLVRGEEAYRSDILCVNRSIVKKHNSVQEISASVLPFCKNRIKKEKVKDVYKLLEKHFGDLWQNLPVLSFYKNLDSGNNEFEDCSYQEHEFCEGGYEENDLRIQIFVKYVYSLQ